MRKMQHACNCFSNLLSQTPELRSDILLTCFRCTHKIPFPGCSVTAESHRMR